MDLIFLEDLRCETTFSKIPSSSMDDLSPDFDVFLLFQVDLEQFLNL